jgi:hypothetical protein
MFHWAPAECLDATAAGQYYLTVIDHWQTVCQKIYDSTHQVQLVTAELQVCLRVRACGPVPDREMGGWVALPG